MIYVLCIISFIWRDRVFVLYFNMIHCCVMGIASWVILSNAFETEADEVVVYKIQKQTILEQSD